MNTEVIVTDSEWPPEVIDAIREGRKIEAIKLLREAKGLGLANAKVLVDRASSKHAERRPSHTMVESHGHMAPLLKALLIVALVFAVYRFFLSG